MKYYLFTFFIVSVTVAIGSTIAVFAICAVSVLSGFDVYITGWATSYGLSVR